VLLMPPRDISELSSNMVKGLSGPIGWEENVRRYVPPAVLEALASRFSAPPAKRGKTAR
jgi:pantetheine-phosphate adenylyltransferase